MNIEEYADILNLEILLTYYPNQNGRWVAKFGNAEIKEGGMLSSEYGNGSTPDEAMANYLKNIIGRRVVINAMRDDRREYNVPVNLTSKGGES